MANGPTRTPSGGAPRPEAAPQRRQQPNYAARRMLVSTIVITAIVAAVVVAWRVVRGDENDAAGTAGSWDQVALVNRTSGDVTFVDDEGAAAGTVAGAGRVVEVHARGDRLALVGNDRLVLVGNDSAAPIDVAIERGAVVTALSTVDSFHVVIGDSNGGNVTIVDAATGATFDVGALVGQQNPLMFAETLRHAPDGTAFAVADAANFQTIMLRPEEPEPRFFPDQAIAIGDELIATSQVVGQEADVTLYDDDRNNKGVATIEIPAGGVMVDDELVVVSVEGTVYRLGRDDQGAERIGDVAVPAGGVVNGVRPTASGERLVVFGAVFQAVIDLDGRTVFTTTFTSPVEAPHPELDWTCLPVGGADDYHSIISLDTGEQIADLTGLDVTGAASDGCTVIGERAGVTELVTADGTVRLGTTRAATLGPDGRTVIVQTTTGDVELLRINDDLEIGEPVDLSELAPSNLAVAFLDEG
jgi:hypothetical protein